MCRPNRADRTIPDHSLAGHPRESEHRLRRPGATRQTRDLEETTIVNPGRDIADGDILPTGIGDVGRCGSNESGTPHAPCQGHLTRSPQRPDIGVDDASRHRARRARGVPRSRLRRRHPAGDRRPQRRQSQRAIPPLPHSSRRVRRRRRRRGLRAAPRDGACRSRSHPGRAVDSLHPSLATGGVPRPASVPVPHREHGTRRGARNRPPAAD